MGTPSPIQSKFGIKGIFELLVPLSPCGLVHSWRNNDVDFVTWYGATLFETDDEVFETAALIQSSFTERPQISNLEVIARRHGQLVHY